jgi:hypothetical protein
MCAVKGPKCLRPLELWDYGFELHAKHVYVYKSAFFFCLCVFLCVGSGLCNGLIPLPRSPTSWSVSFRLILDGNRHESLISQW